jgi:hypothetical protein
LNYQVGVPRDVQRELADLSGRIENHEGGRLGRSNRCLEIIDRFHIEFWSDPVSPARFFPCHNRALQRIEIPNLDLKLSLEGRDSERAGESGFTNSSLLAHEGDYDRHRELT